MNCKALKGKRMMRQKCAIANRWEFVGNYPLVGKRLMDGGEEVRATQQGYRYIN